MLNGLGLVGVVVQGHQPFSTITAVDDSGAVGGTETLLTCQTTTSVDGAEPPLGNLGGKSGVNHHGLMGGNGQLIILAVILLTLQDISVDVKASVIGIGLGGNLSGAGEELDFNIHSVLKHVKVHRNIGEIDRALLGTIKSTCDFTSIFHKNTPFGSIL